MILINEWLPNPTGSDAAGEWIELQNTGSAPVNLSGWALKTSSSKKFIFKNQTVGANGYLVFPRSETKLTLKNTDEKLFLYDAGGRLVDQSGFAGTAQEGKSFSRSDSVFRWATPTPGALNVVPAQTAILSENIAFGAPLHQNLGNLDLLGIMLACGLLLSLFITISIKKDDALSQLFFPRD